MLSHVFSASASAVLASVSFSLSSTCFPFWWRHLSHLPRLPPLSSLNVLLKLSVRYSIIEVTSPYRILVGPMTPILPTSLPSTWYVAVMSAQSFIISSAFSSPMVTITPSSLSMSFLRKILFLAEHLDEALGFFKVAVLRYIEDIGQPFHI